MTKPVFPWPAVPVTPENFRRPPREYGILPFWFLNGRLDPDEMRYQVQEFRQKGMAGIILHGRYGLEMPYIGPDYLDRIRLAVEEAEKAGLQTWIYDEMNWPSGTADKRVLDARPDLAQRYIECLNFPVRGPWFTYLTGADSRYIDFERSKPVAAFAVSMGDGAQPAGTVIDLTPNLSFENVIPWEAPPGMWRLMYIVEKEADYYIDALNPEATKEFLRLGYEPYEQIMDGKLSGRVLGFYTDEPAMHYYVTGGENPIVPWTKDMFQRFQHRNGYNLRPRLPDLFFDVSQDSARVRYDFYSTLTEFYSQAYYKQIYDWCDQRGVLFTGHLLYEEWLRRLIRVEGNIFKHYPHMHVIGVDHLYPIIGGRDRPDEHVAMKVGSSAAHQFRSPRLLCESFGGIFMDATMQRMKWIADWEYVLGVNLLNPHGFHYTLEGPRKRDWPPSQFYQYPWWSFYGAFSDYMSRLSHLLSGGRHVAPAAVLWPLNALFAHFTPQSTNPIGDRTLHDFNTLTDLLLRAHYDFDYLEEDILAAAPVEEGALRVADETYPLLILPPITHIKLSTLEAIERFIKTGGRLLAVIFLPDKAFGPDGLVNISDRVEKLFGVCPQETIQGYQTQSNLRLRWRDHSGGGKTAFLSGSALAGQETALATLETALRALVEPDITITNPEIFYLHRVNDGQDIYFLVNSTFEEQHASVTIHAQAQPMLWDPSTGSQSPLVPAVFTGEQVTVPVTLPPVGSAFLLVAPTDVPRIVETNLTIDTLERTAITAVGAPGAAGFVEIEQGGKCTRLQAPSPAAGAVPALGEEWSFTPENDNALVLGRWWAKDDPSETPPKSKDRWLEMVPGAWAYQLPAEPAQLYPIPVWYRIPFHITTLPESLTLIIDGFAGSGWTLFINGQEVNEQPVRSQVDCQMGAVTVTPYVQDGENEIQLRLVVAGPTDGLLDLVKLMGPFALVEHNGGYSIAAPVKEIQPSSWTDQGYPFYSGRGLYECNFQLPGELKDHRVFLHPQVQDDALEILINGKSVGVRLWTPYTIEITQFLQPGENRLGLRVANTLINLLEATPRPSGLSAAPQITTEPAYHFSL